MKPLVIYHDNCADGFGAAFAAWLTLGDEAEYLPMKYGEVESIEGWLTKNKPVYGGREVYILDFSLPKEVMNELFTYAARVVWLDHHKSSRPIAEALCEYDAAEMKDYPRLEHEEPTFRIVHDNNKSGAILSWEYFHPDTEVPMLIRHIDDYDRWQFKIEGTKAFNKALWSYAPWNFAFWRELNIQLSSWDDCVGKHFVYKEGEAILRAHEQNVQAVVKGAAMECMITTGPLLPHMFDGLAANCPPHLSSDVGHELANQSGTFGLCWTLGKDGKVNGSLRSNGDYDVSAIAKAFGGGGHRNAAGFETDIHTLMGWLG